MAGEFHVCGRNAAALFTLKVHRGDGMALLAMNWKDGEPPDDFVGFAIESKEPGGDRYFALKNRLGFRGADGKVNPGALSTRLSPIQKFRWVHFPRNAELDGEFLYRVSPVFMSATDELSYGEPQEADIELRRETYPGKLNVTFTRGFVASQAFVDHYESAGAIATLLPAKAVHGLDFTPTHPKAEEALAWMGFEARSAIIEVLDNAIADKKAQVRVVAYDLNLPDVVTRLEKLKKRVKIIIDDSKDHGEDGSAENEAEKRLVASAGAANVKRQHMLSLQHNKTIVVDGPKIQTVVCGSTNFSWRGFFVQSNNAVIVHGASAVKPFLAAFEAYWSQEPKDFGDTDSAQWNDLGLAGIDARVAFSLHNSENALLKTIADDIESKTRSSLLYSLAFLYETPGPILEAISKVTNDDDIFVYGISDRKVGGLEILKPDGNIAPVFPAAARQEPAAAVPGGADGRFRHPDAPQVRGRRLRQAKRPSLSRVLQLLVARRPQER